MIKKVLADKRTKRRYSDLVGIDFATTSTKVVRLKQSGGNISLAGIASLPAVDFRSSASRLELPRNLITNYGCISYSGQNAVIRMINTPLQAENDTLPANKLRELLNITEDYRPAARLINESKGRQGASFLAAAIPETDVSSMLHMFSAGPPAPTSLEVSSLAVVPAFLHARGLECEDKAVCMIEAGEITTSFVILNKGVVALVGKVDFGSRQLRAKLAAELGVDDELVTSILSDRSINISSSLAGILAPVVKQISISKEFIERHQGCRVSRTYVSGGLSLLSCWTEEMGDMLQTDIIRWSPLENIQFNSAAVSSEIEEQATRFSAAIGAALGGLKDQ